MATVILAWLAIVGTGIYFCFNSMYHLFELAGASQYWWQYVAGFIILTLSGTFTSK